MPFSRAFSAAPVCLPYQQATPAQRVQALAFLHQRLPHHFPTLRPSTWAQALAEFQPDLWLTGSALTLAEPDVTQLAQHLASSPELPVLDPPLYGLPALRLAQHGLHASVLAAGALPEVVASAPCGPRLYALLRCLTRPNPLAQQVVQAWCWNLPTAPPLPPVLPGRGPAPGSSEVEEWLHRLR
ncbi:hypothetical protein [Hymenobacter norwichensis]|uniref:hypothetical protein n=1 Tax=Hymenobacter norwichensis TaxID=223903 RepID=UPI0012F8B1A4|nr:hypothetical protein [Hymenobacter norwichensis]